MDPIGSDRRKVANIADAAFTPFLTDDGQVDGTVLQVNGGKTGYGFHIYRMAPGATTVAHTHHSDEEFFLIDGDLTDHDGYEYKAGDIVCLASGTTHNSTTKNGCTLVVYLREADGL
ncbi:MAG: cupin domain-containing protein [Pseudomonadota bacterium]